MSSSSRRVGSTGLLWGNSNVSSLMVLALNSVQVIRVFSVIKYGAKSLNFKRILQDKNKLYSNQMGIIFYFAAAYLI